MVANGVLVERKRQGPAGHHALARGRADGALPRVLRGRRLRDAVGDAATASPTTSRSPSTAGLARGRRGARSLRRATCTITAWLENVLGPYPSRATGRPRHQPPGGFALENQTRPTYPRWRAEPGAARRPRARAPVVRRLGLGQQLARHLAQRGFRPVPADLLRHRGRTAAHVDAAWLVDTTTRSRRRRRLLAARASTTPARSASSTAPSTPGARWRVQALRHRIGDVAFWTLLRTWVAQRAYGNGSVADFEALAASVSGQDLDGVLRRLAARAGRRRPRRPTTACVWR